VIHTPNINNLGFTPIELLELDTALEKLPRRGNIKQTESGFLYGDVDNDYIHQAHLLIADKGLRKPNHSAGAHISIIYPEENSIIQQKIFEGVIEFKLDGLFSVDLFNKRYYVLKIISPTIKEIRKNYGLSEKLIFKGYQVYPHITVGTIDLH